ncbi:MAG: hypothetical protein LBD87_01735, partial [Prevotellaceae bacterium]|nr:hypothetical protein [Prevotellaceae bacterium]
MANYSGRRRRERATGGLYMGVFYIRVKKIKIKFGLYHKLIYLCVINYSIKSIMETKFTEQQSLQLITEMINKAQNNVQKGSGMFMIYWGCMTAITALLNVVLIYILWRMSMPVYLSFHIWWIMAPAWIVSLILQRKRDKTAIVKSHIDNIISSVWRAFA